MLEFYEALHRLLDGHPADRPSETVPLMQAAGRISAETLNARFPVPPFDNSAMDGYAVCGSRAGLHTYRVVDRTFAGDEAAGALAEGEAVRIFTGAPLPSGCDAVVMQEDCTEADGLLTVHAAVQPGQHMRLQGEEYAAGDMLLPQGSVLTPAALGLVAAQGYGRLNVYRPLSAAVFSSGNEVCEPGETLSGSRIYDANRPMLTAWLVQQGVTVSDGGILPDDPEATAAALQQAAQNHDLILTSGGASVGEADWIKTAVMQSGRLSEQNIAVKPGKPFAWGNIGRCRIFILPGNPVSAFVTAQMLLLPVLHQMSGRRPEACGLRPVGAQAAFATRKAIKRREFIRVTLKRDGEGRLLAYALPHQGSAMLGSCAAADALAEVPPGVQLAEGDRLTVWLLP